MSNERPVPAVLVDGSNAARVGNSRPSLRWLDLVREALMTEFPALTVTTVTDASFVHELPASERKEFRSRKGTEYTQAPRQADVFLLDVSAKTGAVIVSNDRFRDHPQRIKAGARVMKFMLVPGLDVVSFDSQVTEFGADSGKRTLSRNLVMPAVVPGEPDTNDALNTPLENSNIHKRSGGTAKRAADSKAPCSPEMAAACQLLASVAKTLEILGRPANIGELMRALSSLGIELPLHQFGCKKLSTFVKTSVGRGLLRAEKRKGQLCIIPSEEPYFSDDMRDGFKKLNLAATYLVQEGVEPTLSTVGASLATSGFDYKKIGFSKLSVFVQAAVAAGTVGTYEQDGQLHIDPW